MNLLKSLWNFINTLADGMTRNGREVSPVDEERNRQEVGKTDRQFTNWKNAQ